MAFSSDPTTFVIQVGVSMVVLSATVALSCLTCCRSSGSPKVKGPVLPCDLAPKIVRVDAIAPPTDLTMGGVPVTITGVGFDLGVIVYIGGVVANNIVRGNSTTITANAPVAGAAGPAAVRAVNLDATDDTNNAIFTYLAPLTLAAVNAVVVNGGGARGTVNGGTPVTITGTEFRGTPTVLFGGQPAINVVRVSGTQLTATTPAHVAGQVDVVANNPGEPPVTLVNGFFYHLPRPQTITPGEGGLAGGQPVTIDGECFGDPVQVFVRDQPAANVVRVSETRITATVPAMGAQFVGLGLAVRVTNTNGNQSGTLPSAFRYRGLTVTDVQPNFGPHGGNTAVTLTGTGFSPNTTVRFGGVAAAVACNQHDTLVATTGALPSAATILVDTVVVEGTQTVTRADDFTYIGRALGGAFVPAEDEHVGGSQVSLFGVAFQMNTVVHLGGTQAAAHRASATEMVVTVPARVAPAAPAAVVGASVTEAGVGAAIDNAFTYLSAPPLRNVVVYPGGANGFAAFLAAGGNTVSLATLLRDMHNAGETDAEHVGFAQPVGGLFHAHINGNAEGVMWTRVQDAPDRINQLIELSNGRVGNNYNNRWINTPNNMWFPPVGQNQGARVALILAANALAAGHGTVVAAVNATLRLAGVSPATGPLAGGWNVSITGDNMPAAVAVTFDGVAGANVNRVDATTVTADVPAGIHGLVSVIVRVSDTATGVYAELAAGFTYVALAITAITPGIGDHAGNQPFVLRGTGFQVGATVQFTATPAANVVVRSPTCITGDTPALAAGNVVVTVTNPVGGGTATVQYRYFQ